jgi:acyl-CoA synthetase (NDP forming)
VTSPRDLPQDLHAFTDPTSVAVVGASDNPAKWGYWLATGALEGAGRRTVHLVNRSAATVLGTSCAPDLASLPEAPELVAHCVPAAQVGCVVEDGMALGVRGFLGITAGIPDESGLAARIRGAGARLLGGNSLGLYDADSHLRLAWGHFSPGPLAIVTQSGQLGSELVIRCARGGIGISRFVSIGNQVDVTAVDVLDALVDHEATKAVVLYVEGFDDGRALLRAMQRLREAGKPVVVLTVGATEASRTAARSHTGAMTAATDVVAASCRAVGAVLVDTPVQAVDLAHLLLGSPLPAGRRVAVVSDSGGQGAIAADALTRDGLTVPPLGPETSERLAALLPPAAAVRNPVDLAGAGEQDLTTYSRVVEILLESGDVDSVALTGYFGCYGDDTPELVERELEVVATLADAVRSHGRPVVVHSMSHDSDAVQSMRANSVPTLHTIDAVARSLAIAAELVEVGEPALPEVADAPAAAGRPEAVPYLDGRELLAGYGLSYPGAEQVRDEAEVRAAAARLNAPYVLKAGWLEHKTEVDGVALGLRDEGAAVAAFAAMSQRLGPGGYVLEEMDHHDDVVELIVGGRRDPSFGPVVLVGLGGVQAELYRDVRIALAPVTPEQARSLLESLRGYPLLAGWRGRPSADVHAAAEAVAAVSRLLAEHPELTECEVNPLRISPDGAVAVDALVLQAGSSEPVPSPSLLTGATR